MKTPIDGRHDGRGGHDHLDTDEVMARLLRDPSVFTGAVATGACLEAETLAAWGEGTLLPRERAVALEHLGHCERCRSVLATLCETLPQQQAVAPAAVPWWRRGANLGWLVPATAGAAAVALWLALPGPVPGPVEVGQQAAAPVEEVALGDRLAASPPEAAPAGTSRADTVSEQREQAVPETALAKAEPDAAAAGRPEQPPTEVAARDAGATPARARAETLGQQDRQTAAAPPAAAAAPAADAVMSLNASSSPLVVTSINSPHRWRVSDGRIELSTDSGTTWVTQRTGVAPLAAGSSPAAGVCWLVGPSGLVLLTVDGERWADRSLPEGLDLAGVLAADGRQATVTAANGRRFRTTDGGVTWAPSPPQEF